MPVMRVLDDDFAAPLGATQTMNAPKINYLAFINLLPGLIQFAENIHGAKKPTQKLALVTTLAQSALLTAAAAGVVKPEIANNVAAITDAVEQTLSGMKSEGSLQPQSAVTVGGPVVLTGSSTSGSGTTAAS